MNESHGEVGQNRYLVWHKKVGIQVVNLSSENGKVVDVKSESGHKVSG